MSSLLTWSDPLTGLLSLLIFIGHVLVVCRAVTRPGRTPASRIAWVAVIMSLPLVGFIAYLLLGETNIGRARVRRLHEVLAQMRKPAAAGPDRAALPAATLEAFELGTTIDGLPPVAGNHIRLLGDPDAPASTPMVDSDVALAALTADIDAARESVHISFYIWLDDDNGGRIADAVAAAARRGVACRVCVDALGSRAFTKSPRWAQLKDAGVQLLATLNDIPRLGHLPVGRLDLRNHRKIVVIDNAIAYCGSQNCADPQFRVEARYAPWIDIFFRCEGPVVRQMQYLFLTAWLAEVTTDTDGLESLPAAEPGPPVFEDGAIAQTFGTGPTTPGPAMSDMFVATIFAARADLTITTPYFVPDEALLRAICAAPRRGVRTRIVFPTRNNSWLVADACRSTYPAMLAAGVEIYEYPLGILHTKSMTVDGELALVGSANMDRRSLELNFENNLLVSDREVTASIIARQEKYLSVSDRVAPESVDAWPFRMRLVQNTVGMLGPLL